MNSPRIIELIYNLLSNATALAMVKVWNKANSLVTLESPGGSIGLNKEVYESYDRDQDEATAHISIVLWVKNADPAAGEAEVRDLAQRVRHVLISDRCFGGAVEDSFIHGIEYATADGGKSLLLHLTELDFRVTYMARRPEPEDEDDAPAPEAIDQTWSQDD